MKSFYININIYVNTGILELLLKLQQTRQFRFISTIIIIIIIITTQIIIIIIT